MSLPGTVIGEEITATGHVRFKLEYVVRDTKSGHFRKKKRILKMISSPNFNPHYKRAVIVFPCRSNGPDIAVALHRSVNGVFPKQWFFFFYVSSCVWTAVELGFESTRTQKQHVARSAGCCRVFSCLDSRPFMIHTLGQRTFNGWVCMGNAPTYTETSSHKDYFIIIVSG